MGVSQKKRKIKNLFVVVALAIVAAFIVAKVVVASAIVAASIVAKVVVASAIVAIAKSEPWQASTILTLLTLY